MPFNTVRRWTVIAVFLPAIVIGPRAPAHQRCAEQDYTVSSPRPVSANNKPWGAALFLLMPSGGVNG
jgi:hypothetical protein